MATKLKDIAKLTGVSIATVSLVLNNKPIRISPEKKQEIFDVATKMNYKANAAARTLVTKKSHVLGLIVPDLENIFFAKLAMSLEDVCLKNNYVLLILTSNDKLLYDTLLLDILISRQVDGIFLCPSNESLSSGEMINKLQSITTPLILVDRTFDALEINKVYFDNEAGAYGAVDHLIQKGHRKIAIIAPPSESKMGNSRLAGYIRCLEDHSIPVEDPYIFYGNYKFDSGYTLADEILQTDATAVFSCNDMMTLGFLRAVQNNKKHIPEDISVVSYDNILEEYIFGVEITSVIQDTKLLAEEAFRCFQKYIKTKKLCTRILTTTLKLKESVRQL